MSDYGIVFYLLYFQIKTKISQMDGVNDFK